MPGTPSHNPSIHFTNFCLHFSWTDKNVCRTLSIFKVEQEFCNTISNWVYCKVLKCSDQVLFSIACSFYHQSCDSLVKAAWLHQHWIHSEWSEIKGRGMRSRFFSPFYYKIKLVMIFYRFNCQKIYFISLGINWYSLWLGLQVCAQID